MNKEELNQANWAANRVDVLIYMGCQLDALDDGKDPERRFTLGAEFDKQGKLVPKFDLPRGVRRQQTMGAATTFLEFKMAQHSVERYVESCLAENKRRALAADAWASLTAGLRDAICEFPPEELTRLEAEWIDSGC